MNNPQTPQFGERLPGIFYEPRPGAYGLLAGPDGRLAVLRTPRGLHLPGGGSLPGETPRATLKREAQEEAGLQVGELVQIGEAWEYVYAADEGRYYCKQGVFFKGMIEAAGVSGQEPDHQLVWMAPEEAGSRLTHGSQRWAVAKAGVS